MCILFCYHLQLFKSYSGASEEWPCPKWPCSLQVVRRVRALRRRPDSSSGGCCWLYKRYFLPSTLTFCNNFHTDVMLTSLIFGWNSVHHTRACMVTGVLIRNWGFYYCFVPAGMTVMKMCWVLFLSALQIESDTNVLK